MNGEHSSAQAPRTEDTKCACCEERLAFRWSDTHGVGVCIRCGLPYTLYHYEGEGDARRRVDKPPEPAITDEGVAIARRYWQAERRRVFPACYDMGIGHNGRSYSGASPADVTAFNTWYAREYPRQEVAGG